MKKYIIKNLKEFLLYFIVAYFVLFIINIYKTSDLKVDDSICKNFDADIIHFWATWCPVCKTEISNIEFISRYKRVKTIAVRSSNLQNYSLDIIDDKFGEFSDKYGIKSFPTTIFCKGSKVKFIEVGYTSILGLYLRTLL